MAFPASVQSVQLTRRARGGRPRKRGVVDIEDDAGVGGPVLEFGSEGSARLQKEGRRWKWVWISESHPQPHAAQSVNRLKVDGDAKLLYPGTQLIEPTAALSRSKTLDSSTRKYLSSTVEGFDESGIQPVLEEGSRLAESVSKEEDLVYRSRTMEVVRNDKAAMARSVVVFPTGELGQHLNVSPWLPPSTAAVFGQGISRFIPRSQPAVRFPTPILQICSSPVTQNYLDRDASVLAVRLHASTSLLKLFPNPSYVDDGYEPASYVESMASMTPADTEGRRHVDVALDPTTWCRALVVDDGGAVWLWTESRREFLEKLEHTFKFRKIRSAIAEGRDNWFRVAFGTKPGTAIVMSRTTITSIDFEAEEMDAIELMDLHGSSQFVCLDKTAVQRGVTYTLLCTNQEVMLVDELKVGPPLLSWKHEYGGGRKKDLDVTVIRSDGTDSILLSSRSDPLVMVFNLSFDPPVQSLFPPYSLSLPLASDKSPLHSFGIIHLSRARRDQSTPCLIGMASNGGLYAFVLSTDTFNSGDERRTRRTAGDTRRIELKVVWDESMEDMARKHTAEEDEVVWDRLGRGNRITNHRIFDARWAWLEINSPPSKEQFSIEHFEQHVREIEAPFEHFMLAADLARDVYRDRRSRGKSNLLRPLPQVRTSTDVKRSTAIDYSRHLSVITSRPGAESVETLYALFPHLSHNSDHKQRHRAHILQLAMDLSLSSMVLHTEDLTRPSSVLDDPAETEGTQRTQVDHPVDTDDGADAMARAAEALTLTDITAPVGAHAPEIEFSVLHPRFDELEDQDPDSENLDSAVLGSASMAGLQLPTARSILAEWTLGTDPRSYQWNPWRETPTATRHASVTSSQGPTGSSRPVRPLPSPRAATSAGNTAWGASTRPPQLRPTISVPTLMPATVMPTSSPGYGGVHPQNRSQVPRSSQGQGQGHGYGYGPGFMQTQVERGPHGARPGQKKKVKKRVGGF